MVLASALLFLVGYDVLLCLSFHRTVNAGPRAAGRSLSPDQVTLRHSLLFLVQKANYYWQMITAAVLLAKTYLRPRGATARDVALLIADTSLVTWAKASPLGDGAVAISLCVEGFAFPLLPDRYDNRLAVECELGEKDARTVRFELNGAAIASVDEQLSVLAMMVSSVTHPVIHAFNNRLYESHADERLSGFDDFFLHGQYLNWCAWFWPGLLFRIPRRRGHHWYKRVLAFNAELPVPPHHRASMGLLAPYSRSVRFLLGARPVLARLCHRFELPVDLEALFLCTILHAVDHVGCDTHVRGRLLRNETLPNHGLFNVIALLFYRPAQHFWTNLLKDKRGKNSLYGELYDKLFAIDPELADQVTLSISY
jgi:hypothetical protein